jgi:hypothetical protein
MAKQTNPTDIKKLTDKGLNVRLTEDGWMDPNDESDMAKSQLYKVGKYAAGLINMIKDGEQLDAWVQAKLTKAADYLGAVMHYMEGEKALSMTEGGSDGDFEDQEENKQMAYYYYDKGLEAYSEGDFLKADQYRTTALRYGSYLGWTNNELPPYEYNPDQGQLDDEDEIYMPIDGSGRPLEEAYVPSNIKEFAKRKGVSALVNKIAGWAERVGKGIRGGTAIGKNYGTLILDMGYQTADIYINCDDGTVELYGEPVRSFNEFERVFTANQDSVIGEGLGNEIMTLQAWLIKLNQTLAYEKREGGGKDLKQIAFLEKEIADAEAKLKEKLAQQKQGNVKEITAYDYQQMQEPENLQGDQELTLKAKLRKLLPHLSNEPLDKVEAFLHRVRTNALEYDRMSSNDILSDYQVEYGSEGGMMQEDIEDTRVKPYLTVNPLDTQRAQELRDRYFLNQDIQIDPENETSPRNKFSSYDYDLIEKLRLVLGSNDVEITDHNLDLFPVKRLNEAKSTCCMKCGHMHVQGTKCPDPTYSKDSPKHCKNRKK